MSNLKKDEIIVLSNGALLTVTDVTDGDAPTVEIENSRGERGVYRQDDFLGFLDGGPRPEPRAISHD